MIDTGDLNKFNPFMTVCTAIAGFLKGLPFTELVNYSIYLYGKDDLVQYNLPAIIIKFNGVSSNNTGYRHDGTISVICLRNPTIQNRTAEYFFNVDMMERTILSLASTTQFYEVIAKEAPYISFIAEEYTARTLPDGHGVSITFNVGYLFQYWNNYLNEGNYYPTGEYVNRYDAVDVSVLVDANIT